MSPTDKKLVWLVEGIKTPPLSRDARIETGYYIRLLQSGELLSLPHSRPMSTLGKKCHELRIQDEKLTWRLFYRIDDDAIVISHWISKKTQKISQKDIALAKSRFKKYDIAIGG